MKKRVLVIGLDGFTWRIGQKLMDEGVMPFFSQCIKKGCHGTLQSVMPFETGPAWTAFQTGCRPGKSGVFAFHTFDRESHAIRLNSFADIKVPTLWELLDRAGKTVVSLNMPITSPPPKVKGAVIPGLLCPKLSPATVYPETIYNTYIKPRKKYVIINPKTESTAKKNTEIALRVEKERFELAYQLIEDFDWDLFSIQIQSTDTLQHRTWWALDSSCPQSIIADREDVLEFYRELDSSIQTLIEKTGQETLIIFASDHGFCKLDYRFNINVWLKNKGYLHFIERQSSTPWEKFKLKYPTLKWISQAYGTFKRTLREIHNACHQHILKTPPRILAEVNMKHLRQIIDMDNSRAFALGGLAGLIYITGSQQDNDKSKWTIREELLTEYGPSSDHPVIKDIHDAIEYYQPQDIVTTSPDLVVEYIEGVESRILTLGTTELEDGIVGGKQIGTHARDGIFAFSGSQIKESTQLEANLEDIMPTILAYLDVPVPAHIDGQVLQQVFLTPLDVDVQSINNTFDKMTHYSDTEQALVEKHLRDLGYL